MAVLEATEIELRQETAPEVFHRGEEYFQRGAVEALVRRGDRLEADVRGSDVRPYRVGVPLTKGAEIMTAVVTIMVAGMAITAAEIQTSLNCIQVN